MHQHQKNDSGAVPESILLEFEINRVNPWILREILRKSQTERQPFLNGHRLLRPHRDRSHYPAGSAIGPEPGPRDRVGASLRC